MEAKGFAGLITFRARTEGETRVCAPNNHRQCSCSFLQTPGRGKQSEG
jgi:hypothetical protein